MSQTQSIPKLLDLSIYNKIVERLNEIRNCTNLIECEITEIRKQGKLEDHNIYMIELWCNSIRRAVTEIENIVEKLRFGE